ncbi:F-box only protein 10-like [Argopecten irradians]|uniref:F-box only protein 10-like n=1 Tax=Argopecten irradians TaxID=31199 RepID=UPI00371B7F4B
MSSPSAKPDIGSKVLPGDKTGLPYEIWRIILSYLSEDDLCRSSCVCKTWNDLIVSLDNTRWRELYLQCGDWKHPYWPLNTKSEPPSWKQAFKEQFMSTRFWIRTQREPDPATCLYVLKRRKERKIIHVGRGKEHATLKSALAVARDYDRIVVHPGIYDEQFEMSSKIPFELVGEGELGSVILVVCIEQIAITGRVSNLVFRAPWFTNFILKVRSGYLQVDNCILEDGMVYVQNPGTCHLKFCTLRHATVILQYVNASVIENCEFSQTDSAAITVEGYPREEKNWTYGYLMEKIVSACEISQTRRNPKGDPVPTSAFSTSTAFTSNQKPSEKSCYSKTNSASFEPSFGGRSVSGSAKFSQVHCEFTEKPSSNVHLFRSLSNKEQLYLKESSSSDLVSYTEDLTNVESHRKNSKASSMDGLYNIANPQPCTSNVVKESVLSAATEAQSQVVPASQPNTELPSEPSAELLADPPAERPAEQPAEAVVNHELRLNIRRDSSDSGSRSPLSMISGSDLFEGDDDSIGQYESGSDHSLPGISTSSSDEGPISDGESDFSSSEESVIMLSYPEHQLPRSVSASCSFNADDDVVSISSQNESELIPIVHDDAMQKVLDEVRGCLIRHCRMSQCKGGAMVSLQAQAVISHCDLSSLGYGVRCIQNAKMVLINSEIHHSRTSGVFMRLAASGLIAGNDIHSNCEAGIDIRKNADPIVQSNRIHHGKRSGVVVLGSGRGHINNNEIYQNKEAGVYILYRGSPTFKGNSGCGVWITAACQPMLHGNQINDNGDAGVTFVNKMDAAHEADMMDINRNDMHSRQSMDFWQFANDEKPLPRRPCQKATIEYNSIYHNGGRGVKVMFNDEVAIQCNAIHGNRGDGIFIDQNSDVLVQDNSITCNCGNGIVTSKNGKVAIRGNGIFDNRDNGIWSQNEVDISTNDIIGNQRCAVLLQKNGAVSVQENRIQSLSDKAVNVSMVTKGCVQNNKIYKSSHKAIEVSSGCKCTVKDNSVVGKESNDKKCPEVMNGESDIDFWMLHDPGPRPHIEAPSLINSLPANQVSTVTRVTVPSSGNCEEGSKLCVIL